MSNSLRFLILTHAYPDVGYGHLNRCLILGDALVERGADVRLMVRGEEATRSFFHGREWAELHRDWPKHYPEADLCVIDCYCYEDDFYGPLRRRYDWLASFDDNVFRVPSYVSAVINANIYGDEAHYPSGIRVFTGSEYVLLRREFLDGCEKQGDDILVCVGGSDPANQMDRLLELAVRHTNHRRVHAVFGPGFERHDLIEKWSKHSRITTHQNPPDLPALFERSAFAVSGAGSMLYEFAAMGVPTISIALAENQELLGAAMDEAGTGFYLGSYTDIEELAVVQALEELDKNNVRRSEMRRRAKRLIDGRGANRLAGDLEKWLTERKDGTRTPYLREQVRHEYDESANLEHDYQRQRWGSSEGMFNRYELAMRNLPFSHGGYWIDIGCGTGLLQQLVTQRYPSIHGTGIDLSPALLKFASERNLSKIQFVCCDFLDHRGEQADLLSCLGVLTKTNFNLREFVLHAADLVRPGGYVFVDFKNHDWQKFEEPDFFPEPRHLWFKPDVVCKTLESGDLFVIEQCKGYLPSEDRLVEVNSSHTFFVLLRRLDTKQSVNEGVDER